MALLRDVRSQLGSSYLLDHVDNPVLWRTWDDETLEEARRSDRPIFLSVGYAASLHGVLVTGLIVHSRLPIPVAMAKILGSKMMSSGGKPISSVSSL